MKTKWMWLSAALVAGMVACTDDGGRGDDGPDPDPDPEVCGDKVCRGTETATSCPADCGPQTNPVCGDKKCEGTETAQTCAADCGMQGAVCGNNTCEVGETTSCPTDCPSSLKTVNSSSYTIYNLYVAKCGASDWGVDQTGSGYIAVGSSFTLNGIPPGCYYFRASDSGAAHTWTTPNPVTLVPSSQFTWTLYN